MSSCSFVGRLNIYLHTYYTIYQPNKVGTTSSEEESRSETTKQSEKGTTKDRKEEGTTMSRKEEGAIERIREELTGQTKGKGTTVYGMRGEKLEALPKYEE